MQRAVSKFVPADDLVVPYTATSLDDAESIIHIVKISEKTNLRKQQVGGFYRDLEIKSILHERIRNRQKRERT